MTGDTPDFVSRLRRVLPRNWFADDSPILAAVLTGFGTAWSAIYALIETIRLQTRLSSSTGVFIDGFGQDFFGAGFPRRTGESDAAYRTRIGFELLRLRGTRSALVVALSELTGSVATVFEPSRPEDTGAYNSGGLGYGVSGGWGSLNLPYQSFVKIRRPQGGGISQFAGYGTGGVLAYGDLTMVETQVSDQDIYASVAAVLPVSYRAWVLIHD